jgi:hypothetical protein
MAYGDNAAGEQHSRVSWEEFAGMEYHWRLEELLKEWRRAFSLANTPLPQAEQAGAEWRRLDKELEECALEFVAYKARLRLARFA